MDLDGNRLPVVISYRSKQSQLSRIPPIESHVYNHMGGNTDHDPKKTCVFPKEVHKSNRLKQLKQLTFQVIQNASFLNKNLSSHQSPYKTHGKKWEKTTLTTYQLHC